jgi:hypothetical protein
MKKFNLLMSLLVMSVLVLVSCDDADECFTEEEINVADVTLSADTISVSQSINIEIGVNVRNGCGEYDSATISEDGDTVNVSVKARYDGCICTEAIEYKTGTVTYTPTSTGVKILEFDQGNNQILSDTLVVQ